jgi:hypothetical protein
MNSRLFSVPLSGILVVLIFSVAVVPFVLAVDDIDQAIEEMDEEKRAKQGALDESKERQFLYEQEGLTISERLAALQLDLTNISAEIAAKESALSEKMVQVEEKSQELSAAKVKVEETTLSLYKASRRSIVEILFSSDGMEELLRQMGFRRFGVGFLLTKMRGFHTEFVQIADEYNMLSRESAQLQTTIEELQSQTATLEGERIMYENMVAEESSRQQQLIGEIANITEEQVALIEEKMAATDSGTSVGEYEDQSEELPTPPFAPAYAVASVGLWHRLGMSQYGAYGRAKAGQTYDQILAAYYNATLVQHYAVPSQIYVSGYGWMPFEDQYMKGIAEMPTYWSQSGGYEALKAQAVIARSYALAYTGGGVGHICADAHCQVYYEPKAFDVAAAEWHRAVAETQGQVLVDSAGNPIAAYYIMTAGGYTRLPADFDVGWGGYKEYLKRVIDKDASGKAYDGPGYGDCPWYHKVWYCDANNSSKTGCVPDGHPWLTADEMLDLLNSALLPEDYNAYLSNPSQGGWSYEQVRNKLAELGISPVADIQDLTLVNSDEGYTSSVVVHTSGGLREVGGKRFYEVYRLRSRGNLWLKSGLYDIVVRP